LPLLCGKVTDDKIKTNNIVFKNFVIIFLKLIIKIKNFKY